MSLGEIGGGRMGWDDAVELTRELLHDPSSHAAVAVGELGTVWSVEAEILATIYDRYVRVHFKNPKNYPRPGQQPRRMGRATRPQRDIIAALVARGHKPPPPVTVRGAARNAAPPVELGGLPEV